MLSGKIDGFVKSPSAALRFTFVAAAYYPSTPHFSGFARLASGAFYETISLATFYEFIKIDDLVKSLLGRLPGESRGPERLEITGFRLSPE